MEAAAIMAIALANGGGKDPDWQDFVGIVCLLVINSTISFIEENNAGNAAAALMAGLAPKTKVPNSHAFTSNNHLGIHLSPITFLKLGRLTYPNKQIKLNNYVH